MNYYKKNSLKKVSRTTSRSTNPRLIRVRSNLVSSFYKTAMSVGGSTPASGAITPPVPRVTRTTATPSQVFSDRAIFIKVAAESFTTQLAKTWGYLETQYRPPLTGNTEVFKDIDTYISKGIASTDNSEILFIPRIKLETIMATLASSSAYLLAAGILQSGGAEIEEGQTYFRKWVEFKEEAKDHVKNITIKNTYYKFFVAIRKEIDAAVGIWRCVKDFSL